MVESDYIIVNCLHAGHQIPMWASAGSPARCNWWGCVETCGP